jgi:hypothetical protein
MVPAAPFAVAITSVDRPARAAASTGASAAPDETDDLASDGAARHRKVVAHKMNFLPRCEVKPAQQAKQSYRVAPDPGAGSVNALAKIEGGHHRTGPQGTPEVGL